MARAVNFFRHFAICALLAGLGIVVFLSSTQRRISAFAAGAQNGSRTLTLIPFSDPWKYAIPRWLDIDDRRFHDFIKKMGTPQEFSYHDVQVVLTYSVQQSGGVFRGHIEARGLKPNFAYQIKLCGKPRFGARGWGQFGDDSTNANLGFQGRWWDDTVQKGGWDDYYRSLYIKATAPRRHSMVGYLFAGDFVTDEMGNAHHDFATEKPLHITWQDKQITTLKHHEAGTFISQSTRPPYFGYGGAQMRRNIKLWYEHEAKRPARVNLPAGPYNCRLLITEESFHSKQSAGGHWLTVLATEDFKNGAPDSNPENDLIFEMSKNSDASTTAPLP